MLYCNKWCEIINLYVIRRSDSLSILLDLTILILLVCFTYFGFKNGVIRGLTSFIGVILSIILSGYLSNIVANFIYYNLIDDIIISRVNNMVLQYGVEGVLNNFNKIFSSMPTILQSFLLYSGISQQIINQTINDTVVDIGFEVARVISPLIISVIRTISMSIIFTILMFFVRMISRNIKVIFKIPILKQCDRLIGAILGLSKCLLIFMFVTFIIKMLVPFMPSVPMIFFNETIDDTLVFKYIYYSNPLSILMKEIWGINI